jgi:predicted thioredoxin/glutaredoxin
MRAAECGRTDNAAITHIVETRIVTSVVAPGGLRAHERKNHFRAWNAVRGDAGRVGHRLVGRMGRAAQVGL